MKIAMKKLVVATLCTFSNAHPNSQKQANQKKLLSIRKRLPELILHKINNHMCIRYAEGDMGFKFLTILLWSTYDAK